MVFWLAILGGALFVQPAVRLGFFHIWSLSFNSLVSIYIAIFLAPNVTQYASTTGSVSPYSTALSMIVLAGGCFAILYGLSYIFLTGQFRVSFPEIIDILLAGALGFLTGFLVVSFVALIITVTPLPKQGLAKSMGFTVQSQRPTLAYIARCGDMVHSVVATGPGESPTKTAIERLFENTPKASPARRPQPIDPNVPAVPLTPQ